MPRPVTTHGLGSVSVPTPDFCKLAKSKPQKPRLQIKCGLGNSPAAVDSESYFIHKTLRNRQQ